MEYDPKKIIYPEKTLLNPQNDNKIKNNRTLTSVVLLLLVLIAAGFFIKRSLTQTEIGETYTPTSISGVAPVSETYKKQKEVTQAKVSELRQLSQELLRDAREQKSTALTLEQAVQRKNKLIALMQHDPLAAWIQLLPKDTLASLPQEVSKELESPVTVESKIEVLHVDNFEHPEESKFEYFLDNPEGAASQEIAAAKIPLYLVGGAPPVTSGTTLRVSGFRVGENILAAGDKESVRVISAPPPLESVGTQKTLVILVKYQNTPKEPFSVGSARNIFFNSPAVRFFREVSSQKTAWVGNVVGWYTLPREVRRSEFACLTPDISTAQDDSEGGALIRFLQSKKIDPSKYDRILFALANGVGGCSFVGKMDFYNPGGEPSRLSRAWIGLEDYSGASWWGAQPFSWRNVDFLMAHELGHSLGLWHANSWECGTSTLYGNCQHYEYGNYFDAMGTQSYSLHYNGFYKELLGWLEPVSMLTIDRSGTYTLTPFEHYTARPRVAKIQLSATSTPYYLEYRRAVGFDRRLAEEELKKNQEGLFVNWIPKGGGQFSRLLDMSPHADSWEDWKEVVLPEGDELNKPKFIDAGRGVVIGPIKSRDNNKITFDVKLTTPRCLRFKPRLSELYRPDPVRPGDTLRDYLYIENSDSSFCTPSTFRLGLEGLDAWEKTIFTYKEEQGFVPTESLVLEPESYPKIVYLEIKVPQEATSGVYEAKFVAKRPRREVTELPLRFVVDQNISPDKGGGGGGKGAPALPRAPLQASPSVTSSSEEESAPSFDNNLRLPKYKTIKPENNPGN